MAQAAWQLAALRSGGVHGLRVRHVLDAAPEFDHVAREREGRKAGEEPDWIRE